MDFTARLRLLFVLIVFASLAIVYRLFYWQVIASPGLTAAAENQHWVSFPLPSQRGEILASDGFPLVTNRQAHLLYASIPDLNKSSAEITDAISPILGLDKSSTEAASIKERLSRQDLVWVSLARRLSPSTRQQLEELGIAGLGFENENLRGYPEGSMAAHLVGFVGEGEEGPKGFFGLEGFYDLELRGQPGSMKREKDIQGSPILIGQAIENKAKQGRTLQTTINRSVQYLVEKKLEDGLRRYGATSGSIIVLDPKSGAILSAASRPAYDPLLYWQTDPILLSDPVISASFEPGSIFKVLIMAAALDAGVVKPDSRCPICNGPKQSGEYTIETWNDQYYPDSTMTEIIQHSDNVGMVYVAEQLGLEKLYDYLQQFGIGSATRVDLEGENVPQLRPKKDWSVVDLDTSSFGQGIAVTPLQMAKSVAAIANQGRMMRPYLVKQVISGEGSLDIKPKEEGQVIRPVTAKQITEMMVNAVEKGEAKWAKPKGYRIAGKTGTAQIPIAGHYDQEKTIASFIGFAPADDPAFLMLVTLREPSTSPWGSETAAPLWFEIAKEIFGLFSILPE